MRRLALLVLVLLPLAPARADALTVRDVVELTRAGLGDEVLLALIEVDRSVFTLDAPTLMRLKKAGVSERVIVAMIRSGREPVPPPEEQVPESAVAPEPAAPPPPVVIEPQEIVREVPVPVAVPVFVPVPTRHVEHNVSGVEDVVDRREDRRADRESEGRKHEPVYWGWGGQLRPDAWKPKQ